ncbi:MAG: hypothetical protein DRQ35_01425 [Gammaproteobacteria bacterium]|nr:MAG: hypothetical protein DRQ35_01425 [Gammaproteobacteria bacterium]
MYKLNKRLAFILMSKYSILFLDAVVSRWEKLEIEAAAVNTINLKREEVRQLERSCARIDCPVMAEAIMQCNIRAGKSLKFIYSNEHNMIYRIVLGMTYKEYLVFNGLPENADIRDVLSGDEIELVKKLQREVTTLADLDIIYRDRKELLNKKYSRLKVEKRLANK